MIEREYDRKKAVNYARRWAKGRNPQYYNFDALGGDCTNFVSQCLYAGSGVMNFGADTPWYYISLSQRSPSWTGVEFLYDFLINNKSAGPYASEVSGNDVFPGDVVQLGKRDGDFYHCMIITAVSPRILIASHSFDALNRPLSTYNYEEVRFLHIEGVRIL